MSSANANEITIAVDPDVHLRQDEYDPRDWNSETTSIGSSIYRGIMENGRRYQSLKEDEYAFPADEQQFDTYDAVHLAAIVGDSAEENPLFHAPIEPKNVLDIGTGKGSWAVDVADMFPEAWVRGVDLFPPPVTWLPPNCVLEVDDVTQDWTWSQKFDLIHLRILACAFTPEETADIMKKCYDNLQPGGWIEQFEIHPNVYCDDASIAEDNVLYDIGPRCDAAANKSGKRMDLVKTMRDSIAKAGFVDIHEKATKWPIGPWPREKSKKELGSINLHHWLTGIEGYTMFLMTKFGDPEPWTQEEVRVYNAQMRKALLNPHHHPYQRTRRVWARKPFPEEEKARDEKEKEKKEKKEKVEAEAAAAAAAKQKSPEIKEEKE
ncbi:hypothetical protein N7509_004910 [Penicillium cosmopolitanum]|uniref:Methyltransferase domain-containing protein n=1 Tax=Penicillium cosmopolitanum TaxID=1131564 RepID=A0A9X0B9L2_9EURO|nr:uncharacterized protein N7509_004910 [Penicillium cosmopolitanum]KAJ5396797.1 hypothetical protein N7509_004910 [Penicillium cosmopolitanum]